MRTRISSTDGGLVKVMEQGNPGRTMVKLNLVSLDNQGNLDSLLSPDNLVSQLTLRYNQDSLVSHLNQVSK